VSPSLPIISGQGVVRALAKTGFAEIASEAVTGSCAMKPAGR